MHLVGDLYELISAVSLDFHAALVETSSSEDTVQEAIYVYIMDFDCGAVQSCTQLYVYKFLLSL